MDGTEVENYLLMVENDGNALCHVPTELKTLELCRASVEQNGYALDYVPEALRDKM